MWIALSMTGCGCTSSPGTCAPVEPLASPYDAYEFLPYNFATAASSPLNVFVDLTSFTASTGASVTASGMESIIVDAMGHWNGAADVTLDVSSDEYLCEEVHVTRGRQCAGESEFNDVWLATSGDDAGLAAYTYPMEGKDENGGCLVAADVPFFPLMFDCTLEGVDKSDCPEESRAYTDIRWVERSTDVVNTSGEGSAVDKPIYNVFVHELGHVLGLGEQDTTDASVACSVMAHCAATVSSLAVYDSSCACDFESITPLDALALRAIYGGP